jgi:hypothetical protein
LGQPILPELASPLLAPYRDVEKSEDVQFEVAAGKTLQSTGTVVRLPHKCRLGALQITRNLQTFKVLLFYIDLDL